MKNVPVSSVIAIVFGLLVLFSPHLISYILGFYLILIGVLGIKRS